MDERTEEGSAGKGASADLTGSLLADKYKVIRPLGRGSTGTVYHCSHVTLEKEVAVKVLHPELSTNPGMVARFQREAQAAARLDHPHSVRVIDVQAAGDLLYLAMDYVEGRDLAQVLAEEWPLSDERVVTVMSQILSALAAAHELGIVHRDLKPENILVRAAKPTEDGETQTADDVLVCDFGLAQLSPIRLNGPSNAHAMRLHSVTAQGRVVGTPAYMSPEQARAESQDARSDIYSAGVLLFQLLTRTLPFVAETPLSVAVMHCVNPPPPPSGYRPVNAALEAVCLKALSKTREARYQSAREMQLALEAALPKRSVGKTGKRLSTPPASTRASRPEAQLLKPDGALITARSSRPAFARSRNHSLSPAELVVPSETAPRRRLSSRQRLGVALALLALVGVPSLLTRATHPRHPHPRAAAIEQAAPALPLTAAEPNALAALPVPVPVPSSLVAKVATAEPATIANATRLKSTASAEPAASPAPAVRRPTRRAVERAREPIAPKISDAPQPTAADTASAATQATAEPVLATRPTTEIDPPSERAETKPVAVDPEPIAAALPAPIVLAKTASPASAASNEVAPVTALVLKPRAEAEPVAHEIDPARAHVAIGNAITHHAAVSRASVRGALNEAGLNRCYQDALRAGDGPQTSVDAQLDLSTGMGGRVTSATLQGGLPKSLRACIEQVARAGRLREADTGETQASIPLTFRPQ